MKVRFATLSNPRTPITALRELAEDGLYTVRVAVAHHENCTIGLASQLSRDFHPVVRRAALRHRELPTDDIERLTRDADAEVRETASNRLAYRRLKLNI